eukprot:maker-scaffold990_size72856-snap-gene-0.22 protein:Tk06274 transcript:maker-scaffold990_size72856-snap-gene-0.22-mRNA-1 annotation:"mitochondrial 39s ribosomal protein l39"
MSVLTSKLVTWPRINLKGLQRTVRCQSTGISPSSTKDLCVPSKNAEIRKMRSQLFAQEQTRQLNQIPRLERIQVQYKGIPEDSMLSLNKSMSTPYNVAQHLAEYLMERSALALVNGKIWDMHRPLEEDCTVELMHFRQDDPFQVNRAFWRSCSFMMGSVLEEVFKDDIYVELHSFPAPNVNSGSFVHDVDLKMSDWRPCKTELMTFSAAMHRLAQRGLPFERLEVNADLALEMFKDNQYKVKQIPSISSASQTGSSITLYRLGDHVDISRGPMMANSSFLGRRCTIAAAHPIQHEGKSMYRFQGVALPKDMFLNHFAFGVLEKRAAKLNEANIPSKIAAKH